MNTTNETQEMTELIPFTYETFPKGTVWLRLTMKIVRQYGDEKPDISVFGDKLVVDVCKDFVRLASSNGAWFYTILVTDCEWSPDRSEGSWKPCGTPKVI